MPWGAISNMGYNTHYPILAACVARTTGPILELGCGESSTPMLHLMAHAMKRRLHSVDTDPAWLKKYDGYYQADHSFEIVAPHGDDALPLVTRQIEGWRRWLTSDMANIGNLGVVFVDCAPGEARHMIASFFARRAQIVLCHDSEKDYAAGGNYMYDQCIPEFKYVSEWRRWRPYTLILSNFLETPIDACDQVWEPPK